MELLTELMDIIEQSEEESTGTRYIGMHFDKSSRDKLNEIAAYCKTPNKPRSERFHITITYSRGSAVEGYEVEGSLDSPVTATINEFTIFPTQEGHKALVVLLSCEECVNRHKKTIELGATFDYPEYRPHVTISYNMEDVEVDLDELTEKYKGTELVLDEEYEEPLKLDWINDDSNVN